MAKSFKQFLIAEQKYEGGIDVDVDERTGRISKVGEVSKIGRQDRDPRSEADASAELEKHAKSKDARPNATTLSPAEKRRAELRKRQQDKSGGLLSKVISKIADRFR